MMWRHTAVCSGFWLDDLSLSCSNTKQLNILCVTCQFDFTFSFYEPSHKRNITFSRALFSFFLSVILFCSAHNDSKASRVDCVISLCHSHRHTQTLLMLSETSGRQLHHSHHAGQLLCLFFSLEEARLWWGDFNLLQIRRVTVRL